MPGGNFFLPAHFCDQKKKSGYSISSEPHLPSCIERHRTWSLHHGGDGKSGPKKLKQKEIL